MSNAASLGAASSTSWSRLNITLHWLITALIVVQLLDHDGMEAWWRSSQGRGAVSSGEIALGWMHIVAGVSIFVFTAIRIWDRYYRGRPAYSSRTPVWAVGLSKLTHALLFAILIVMPLAGLAAWISGSRQLAALHTFLWAPLLVLAAMHVAGALAEHFVFRTDALMRMLGRRT